jgi:hypothetical protein
MEGKTGRSADGAITAAPDPNRTLADQVIRVSGNTEYRRRASGLTPP